MTPQLRNVHYRAPCSRKTQRQVSLPTMTQTSAPRIEKNADQTFCRADDCDGVGSDMAGPAMTPVASVRNITMISKTGRAYLRQ